MSADLARMLAHLPDDAQLTIIVRKSDLARALATRPAGPIILTTVQASRTFGYGVDCWRKWCVAGRIDGCYQDTEGGSWHLPRTACEAHIATLARRGRAPRRIAIVSQSPRSRPRGPWKTPKNATGASA